MTQVVLHYAHIFEIFMFHFLYYIIYPQIREYAYLLCLCRRLKMAMETGRAVNTTTRTKPRTRPGMDISESTIVNPEREGTAPPER